MIFWLLALVLLASLAGIGYRQGAIRVAFSFVGILAGVLLAAPLGKLLQPLLVILGLKTPALAWLLAPLIMFVLISAAFKIAALMVHQKVEVHFKYHAGELRLALWERLNRRLGLCLGLANGTLYVILLAALIYPFSYWTVQIASSGEDPSWFRLFNRLGQDLQDTGVAKVSRAMDPMPQVWYDTADFAGIYYNNSLIEARLARYPAFLGLAERPEFQEIASDTQFTELRQRREPIMKLFDYPKTQAMLQNPVLLALIWNTVVPDLADLRIFLDTGKSPKYDPERILGCWTFNVGVSMGQFRRTKPNITSADMQKWKKWMALVFAKTSFVAMTDHQAILKNVPPLKVPTPGAAAAGGVETLKGEWKGAEGKYQLTLTGGTKDEVLAANVENDRLTMSAPEMSLVFDRAD